MINELIEKEKYEEALELIGDKHDEESLYQKVWCLVGLMRYEEALAVCKEGIANSSKLYYDILTLEISVLLELGLDDDAIKILEEELSMPYIPGKYEYFLASTYDQLLKKRKTDDKGHSPYDMLSDDELKELLSVNSEAQVTALAIYQLERRNIRTFIDVIKKYLIESKNGYLKTMLLEVLREQGVNDDFKLVNKGLEITVNPLDLAPFMEQIAIPKIVEIIRSFNTDNDITINQDAYDLLISYLASIYPIGISEDEYEAIGCAVYYAALASYRDDVSLKSLCKQHGLKEEIVEAYYDDVVSISVPF